MWLYLIQTGGLGASSACCHKNRAKSEPGPQAAGISRYGIRQSASAWRALQESSGLIQQVTAYCWQSVLPVNIYFFSGISCETSSEDWRFAKCAGGWQTPVAPVLCWSEVVSLTLAAFLCSSPDMGDPIALPALPLTSSTTRVVLHFA